MWGLNDWGRVLVSIIVVAGFLAILVLVLTTKLQGSATPDILLVMLGALAAAFQQVISYWVGSSSGSAQKDTAIQNMAAKS
jgi:protein-S-isoprenylcysteine O-methyltransferase Ste14